MIYLSPQGRPLDHGLVMELGELPALVLLAGRYEGVDERLIGRQVDYEISIGDYVLSGGELAAMVLIDCLVRQMPGVLGDPESASQDSFVSGIAGFSPIHAAGDISGKCRAGSFDVRQSCQNQALAFTAVAGQDMAEATGFAGIESRTWPDERRKEVAGRIPARLTSNQLKPREYKVRSANESDRTT